MIRLLNADEVERLRPLCEEFFRASRVEGDFVPAHFFSVWRELLAPGGNGVAIVSEDNGELTGLILGFIHTDPITADTVALEAAWWTAPSARGAGTALLEAFERQAERRGAQRIYMACLESLRPKAVGRLYERRGYRKIETTYTKAI